MGRCCLTLHTINNQVSTANALSGDQWLNWTNNKFLKDTQTVYGMWHGHHQASVHLPDGMGRHGTFISRRNMRTFSTGNSIASCSGDKTVRIWQQHGSTDTWVCAAILEETHHRSIRCSSWSPDGRYLATASFDATTAIWEVQVNIILSEINHMIQLLMHKPCMTKERLQMHQCAIQTK